MIECVEVNGAATVDLIEEAFLKRLDTVVVTYSQESGNRYSCMLCEFSLGEAAILIQAIDALENKTSGSDRHVALINKWADDFKTRTEKKYANGTP